MPKVITDYNVGDVLVFNSITKDTNNVVYQCVVENINNEIWVGSASQIKISNALYRVLGRLFKHSNTRYEFQAIKALVGDPGTVYQGLDVLSTDTLTFSGCYIIHYE